MSHLRAAVFVAKPIPAPGSFVENWSPISCTLVYDDKNALLVDTPIDIEQSEELALWIKKIAPGRQLETVYITHGHPDHWFGLPIIRKHFPSTKILATEGSIKHAHENIEPTFYANVWGAWFGERIAQPFVLPDPLPPGNKFLLSNKWECEAVEAGHTDTCDTTFLWIPELKLVVGGDVVYGQVHQMLGIGTTPEQRAEWIAALDLAESYRPTHVVAGHQQAEEIPGPWTIASTRTYIRDFERILEEVLARDGSADEAYEEMLKIHGERANPGVLKYGFDQNFAARKK